MSEYIKDPAHPAGWKTVSHDKDKYKDGIAPDAANLNPDAMDEGFEDVSEIEPEVRLEVGHWTVQERMFTCSGHVCTNTNTLHSIVEELQRDLPCWTALSTERQDQTWWLVLFRPSGHFN